MPFLPPVTLDHPLYFFRHGETDWNREKRCQGLTDIPLNPKGEEQARRYGRVLGDLVDGLEDWRLVSSPLTRATRTLELICAEMDALHLPRETDERLTEINHGEWCGFTYDEIRERWPADYAALQEDKWATRRPDGESYADRLDPVLSFLRELDGPAIVVGHGGTGRVLRALIARHPPGQVVYMEMRQDRFFGFSGATETVHHCAAEQDG